ncbi:MAG: DUF2237 domain-containing protein [Myxococcota bacterium]
MERSLNVLGTPLAPCSDDPVTGWFRDGCCNTDASDRGSHTVCVEVSARFLAYLEDHGNDLSTPRRDLGFPGLSPGDRWCVCAASWADAAEAGVAGLVFLEATHARALEIVSLELLMKHAYVKTEA